MKNMDFAKRKWYFEQELFEILLCLMLKIIGVCSQLLKQFYYLAHVIEKPNLRIPNHQYLQLFF